MQLFQLLSVLSWSKKPAYIKGPFHRNQKGSYACDPFCEMQLKNEAVKTIFDLFPLPGTEASKYIFVFLLNSTFKIPVEMLQFQTGTCNVILNVRLLKTAVCLQHHKKLVLYLFKCSLYALNSRSCPSPVLLSN